MKSYLKYLILIFILTLVKGMAEKIRENFKSGSLIATASADGSNLI